MNHQPNFPALGEEVIPADEAQQIERVVQIFRNIQEEKDRRHRPVPRSVHPKQHGCVWGELLVEPGLPGDLRHGLFREQRTCAALVRFSNSKQRNDELPDAHGAAIKLLDVPGPKLLDHERDATTHDFVLIDHPVFFARNVADLIPLLHDFQRLMIGGIVEKCMTALKAALAPDYRYRLIRRMVAKRPDNPLEIQYWSTTPFKFGDGAAKFSLRPQLDGLPARPEASADKLRLALSRHLREREARFDFLVQLQTNPATMPIEDPTVEWNERESPYRKIATLRLPRQAFEAPEQASFGEALAFTPWHALPEHRPLGGINRARGKAYEITSARRRELSGASKREPTVEEARALFPRNK